MILRKSFYIRWSAGRSPRVHEVNPGRDPSVIIYDLSTIHIIVTFVNLGKTNLDFPNSSGAFIFAFNSIISKINKIVNPFFIQFMLLEKVEFKGL